MHLTTYMTRLAAACLLVTFTAAHGQSPLTDKQIEEIGLTYPTPFGNVRFLNSDGKLAVVADRIELDSKVLLTKSAKPDGWGNSLFLMPMDDGDVTAVDTAPKKDRKLGRAMTKRMIVAEGADGNCLKQFILLDFTLEQPFVSKPFGENVGMKQCLFFEKAKWGKKEARIKLGNGTFVYTPGSDLVEAKP
jgi:hypothetical protein